MQGHFSIKTPLLSYFEGFTIFVEDNLLTSRVPPIDPALDTILNPAYGSAGGLMPYQQRKPRRFGADDRPACPNCRKPTFLTRRGPDADYDIQHERQTFTCLACGHQIERIVDADGNPPK